MKTINLLVTAFFCVFTSFIYSQTTPCFPDTNLYCAGTTAISVATADFNNDNYKDVVAINQNGGHSILMSDGGTDFTTTFYSDAITQNYVVTGLFNADGFPDFAISNGSGADVYLGNGDGTFVATLNAITATSNSRALAADDYNTDGIIDIAVLENLAGQVEIFFGNGDGTFTLGNTHSVGASPGAIASGYFNADGFVDLAVVSSSNNTLTVSFGVGNGTFSPDSVFTTDAVPYFIVSGDFNNDGLTDLAVANFGSSSVSLFAGNGAGSFSLLGTYPTGPSPTEIAAGDLNADGNLDIVSIGLGASNIYILQGNGNGVIGTAVPHAVNGTGVSVRIDDLHNNGLLDVVAGHLSNQGVTVLTNQMPELTVTSFPAAKVCAGDSVKLTALGADTYTWSHGVINDAYFVPTSSATYTVVGLDTISGCTSYPETKTITYYVLPIVGVTVTPNDTVCAGDEITLNGNGGMIYTYSAGVNDGAPFNIDSTQTFVIDGEDAAQCSNTDSIRIVVRALPTIGISVSPNDTVCSGDMITLNGTGGMNYVFDNAVADGLPFQIDSTLTFTVVGEDVFQCSNTDSIQIVAETCVGIKENLNTNAISVYPNPTVSDVTIANLLSGDLIFVTDILGNTVFNVVATASDIRIKTDNLSNGVYFIKGQRGAEFSIVKLIINK